MIFKGQYSRAFTTVEHEKNSKNLYENFNFEFIIAAITNIEVREGFYLGV